MKLRIVDLGLLANRRLTLAGYAALRAILAAERQDVIEAQEVSARARRRLSGRM